ncbi:hypothetical protein M9458_004365, partial [Cirrhinus mrigala]
KNKLILTSRSNPPAPPRPLQVQPDTAPRERELVLTRSGSVAGPGPAGGWVWAAPLAKQSFPKATTLVTEMQSVSSNYATILQGEQQRDYPGTLGRGGLEMGSGFVVGRPEREASIPLSAGMRLARTGGDNRVPVGKEGYDASAASVPRPGPGLWKRGARRRVGEFLRLRLAQPPYDSVQVYGLEGTGSRAGEGGKDAEKDVWGSGLEDWGPQFQKLAQLFREREKESGEDKEGDVEASKKHKDREWEEKEEQSGDEEQAN